MFLCVYCSGRFPAVGVWRKCRSSDMSNGAMQCSSMLLVNVVLSLSSSSSSSSSSSNVS